MTAITFSRFPLRKFWKSWGFFLFLRLTGALPLWLQGVSGQLLGWLLLRVMRRERHVADVNLRLCFPAATDAEHNTLLRAHFAALGRSFPEMGLAWYASRKRLRRLIAVEGAEHLTTAIEAGKPVLLWGAHFTCLEVGVQALADLVPDCACMYRPQRNAMMDALILNGRGRFSSLHIQRDDVRTLLRTLRNRGVVVYFPDQTHVGNQSAMIPFFGEPASTNIAASKFSKLTGAVVLPFFYSRKPGSSGYRVSIGAPLDGLPGPDPAADSARLVAELERHIRRAPEQYLWTYKKFKRRPPGYPDPYAATINSQPRAS